MKNTHGAILLLAEAYNFTKSNTLPWVFFTNCTNGTKLRKASHMLYKISIYVVLPQSMVLDTMLEGMVLNYILLF